MIVFWNLWFYDWAKYVAIELKNETTHFLWIFHAFWMLINRVRYLTNFNAVGSGLCTYTKYATYEEWNLFPFLSGASPTFSLKALGTLLSSDELILLYSSQIQQLIHVFSKNSDDETSDFWFLKFWKSSFRATLLSTRDFQRGLSALWMQSPARLRLTLNLKRGY